MPSSSPLIRHPSIEIRHCKWGWGVFARADIPANVTVEECPFLDLPIATTVKRPLLDYVFTLWDSENPRVEAQERRALVLGFGSLFNHSQQPNITYTMDKSRKLFCFSTNRKVRAGEQLCVSYGQAWWDTREGRV